MFRIYSLFWFSVRCQSKKARLTFDEATWESRENGYSPNDTAGKKTNSFFLLLFSCIDFQSH